MHTVDGCVYLVTTAIFTPFAEFSGYLVTVYQAVNKSCLTKIFVKSNIYADISVFILNDVFGAGTKYNFFSFI